MKILVILAHPDKNSFNHAIAHAACKTLHECRHEVIFHDLCAEGFDPLITRREIPSKGRAPPLIQKHCDELAGADGIIVVHPNWWGQPPAILKGWIDRVIRPGVAYRFEEGDGGEGVPVGLLRAQTALVFNTANTPAKREKQVFGDPLARIWAACVFELCGVRKTHRKVFGVVVASTKRQREKWLKEVQTMVQRQFPRRPARRAPPP